MGAMELHHAKKIIRQSAAGLGFFLLTLLIIKNVLRPYSVDAPTSFAWFDYLLISSIIVGSAVGSVYVYRLIHTTAQSLYAGVKIGFLATLFAGIIYALTGIIASGFVSQMPESAGIVFSNITSILINRIVFNLFALMAAVSIGTLFGLVGGGIGWLIGVAIVHGVIQPAQQSLDELIPEETNLGPIEHDDQVPESILTDTHHQKDVPPIVKNEKSNEEIDEYVVNVADGSVKHRESKQDETTTDKTVKSSKIDAQPEDPDTTTTDKKESPIKSVAAAQAANEKVGKRHATPLNLNISSGENSTPLRTLTGITDSHIRALKNIDIHDIEGLLEAGHGAGKRTDIASKTGINSDDLLTYINMADLMRVPGVNGNLARLLEIAGVNTVVELGRRNVDNLYFRLKESNNIANLVDLIPTKDQAKGLINAAKTLDRVVSH